MLLLPGSGRPEYVGVCGDKKCQGPDSVRNVVGYTGVCAIPGWLLYGHC